jgi:hypothetical protein
MAAAPQLLGPPLTAAYRPRVVGRFSLFHDHSPLFALADVEEMRRDGRIRLGLRAIKSPVSVAKMVPRASDKNVAAYVARQLKYLWKDELESLLLMIEYGTAGGEAVWARKPKTGLVELDCLRHVHHQDLQPLELDHKFWGVRIRPVNVDLPPGRGFWLVNQPDLNKYWGQSRLHGAWQPWKEKCGRHGARDVRRLWNIKNCFGGGMLRHPPGSTRDEFGVIKDNADYARELLEKLEAGGTIVLPNTRDENGNYLWEFIPAAVNGDVPGIRETVKDLDNEIFEGMEIPLEIIQASESGSGWAGRTVPFLLFLTGEDQIVWNVVQTLKRQLIDHGVRYNFGGEADYEIEVESLVPKDKDTPGGGAALGGAGGQPSGLQPYQGPSGGHGQKDPNTVYYDKMALGDESSNWVAYEGPHGGHGFRNVKTGRVVYGDEPPGHEEAGHDAEPDARDADVKAVLADPARLDAASEEKSQSILSKIAGLPAAVVPQRVKDAVGRIKDKALGAMKARYGERATGLIIKAAVLSAPVPVPGSQPLAIAVSLLAAEAYRAWKKLRPTPVQMAHEDDLSPDEALDAAKTWLEEMRGELESEIGDDAAALSFVELAQTDDPWKPYVGKRGPNKGKQVGYRNAYTGRVVYGDRKPGRRYSADDTGPAKRTAPAKQHTAESVTATANEVLKNPTREGVLSLLDGLLGLKLADMRKVRAAIGGEAGGRSKSDLAKKIAVKIEGAAEPKAEEKKAAKKPAAKPTDEAHAAYDAIKSDLGGLSVDEMRSRFVSSLAGRPKEALNGILQKLGYSAETSQKAAAAKLLDNLTSLKMSKDQTAQIGGAAEPKAEEKKVEPKAVAEKPFGVGETLNYTGRAGTMPAEFRGFHADPDTGERVARVIVRPETGPPFEASVKTAELSRPASETPAAPKSAAKKRKEPHEMTAEEFDSEVELNGNPLKTRAHRDADEYRRIVEAKVREKYGRDVTGSLFEAEAKAHSLPDDRTYWDVIQAGLAAGPTDHKAAVEAAIAAGKTVPAEVLADYPDLAAKIEGVAEPKAEKPASKPPSEQDVVNAMSAVEKDALKGGMVSLAELRKHMGLPKPVFDKAIRDMSAAGRLDLHKHVTPGDLSDAEKDALIPDGEGKFFIGAVLREPTTPAAAKAPDLKAFEEDVRGMIGRHAQSAGGVGADIHEIYQTAGQKHGLSKEQFKAALADLHKKGVIRLSGWHKSTDDLPDPDVVPSVAGKVMGFVQPATAAVDDHAAEAGRGDQSLNTAKAAKKPAAAQAVPAPAADPWLPADPVKSGAVLKSVMAVNSQPGARVDLAKVRASSGLSDKEFDEIITHLATSGALTAAVKSGGAYTSAAIGHPRDARVIFEGAAVHAKPAAVEPEAKTRRKPRRK